MPHICAQLVQVVTGLVFQELFDYLAQLTSIVKLELYEYNEVKNQFELIDILKLD